jgi:pimeloyl-ACP methyl ester carboxylesterase
MNIRLIAITLIMGLLVACEQGPGQQLDPYAFDCSGTPSYTESSAPITYTASGATTTVIVLHGKTGYPNSSHLIGLYTDLQNAGYEVKAPYMPWNSTTWDGTLCQAMGYVGDLVQTEKDAGKNVILIGHSMGGAGVLIYNIAAEMSQPDATVAIAPGHFMHLSNTLQTQTAASVATARDMVTAGNGDTNATFQTYNNGSLQDIATTANIFLSYHDLDQYPDITNDVLPSISAPLYWIGGDSDNLTTAYGYTSLFNRLPSNSNS